MYALLGATTALAHQTRHHHVQPLAQGVHAARHNEVSPDVDAARQGTGRAIHRGHQQRVGTVAVVPDGRRLGCGSGNGNGVLLSAQQQQQ